MNQNPVNGWWYLGAGRKSSLPRDPALTVGFGMGNYNDALMEQLADHGDGFYAYVNTIDDAQTLFGTS